MKKLTTRDKLGSLFGI